MEVCGPTPTRFRPTIVFSATVLLCTTRVSAILVPTEMGSVFSKAYPNFWSARISSMTSTRVVSTPRKIKCMAQSMKQLMFSQLCQNFGMYEVVPVIIGAWFVSISLSTDPMTSSRLSFFTTTHNWSRTRFAMAHVRKYASILLLFHNP